MDIRAEIASNPSEDVELIVSYLESPEEAKEISRKAVERMRKETLDPIPESYTVWYAYYAGHYPELNKIVDQILEEGAGITTRTIAHLYAEYFGTRRQQRALEEASNMVQNVLSELLRLLESAGVETGRYSEALGGLMTDIPDDIGVFQLRAIVDELTQETRKMLDQNKELSTELTSQTERMQKMQQDLEVTRKQALTDPLTGIANRKKLDSWLHSLAHMSGAPDFFVLMIDIDHFKTFNDTHGHQIGDNVLRLVANVIAKSVGKEDLAARYGGEEFAVILRDREVAEAMELAEHIRRDVGQRRLVNKAKNVDLGTITLSIGLTSRRASEEPAETVARADHALYAAKNSGRNKVVHMP